MSTEEAIRLREKAHALMKDGGDNRDEVLDLIKQAAELGDAESQVTIGHLCLDGRGMPQDESKAVEWFTKAANQGYAEAQNSLGACYQHAYGVSQNHNKAIEWYTKAANQGNETALYNLGHCYFSGMGVSQDYNKAVEWWSKAASLESAEAQNSLGACYQHGYGVPQDYDKAIELYIKAANQGNSDAQRNLEQLKRLMSGKKSGGCYIATCVYGSYDAPEVWTLRRYRDEKLSASWLGRKFVQSYYAVSPKIVKLFGKQKWFTGLCKPILDKFVNKLQVTYN